MIITPLSHTNHQPSIELSQQKSGSHSFYRIKLLLTQLMVSRSLVWWSTMKCGQQFSRKLTASVQTQILCM